LRLGASNANRILDIKAAQQSDAVSIFTARFHVLQDVLTTVHSLGMSGVRAENLFRTQAIRSLSEKPPGRPICLIPRPWLWLNILLTILFLSTALFAGNAEYSRKESVRGWLISTSGVVRIANNTAAVVREVASSPGDHVSVGEPLIYLSMDSTLSDGNDKNEQVLSQLREEIVEVDTQLKLSQQQQDMEGATLTRQLHAFDKGVRPLLARLDEQQHRVDMSRGKLQRIEGVVESGAVTEWDVLRQQEELGVLEQDLARLEQDIASQQRERELLKARQGGAPVRAEIQRSTLRARRMQLSQQIAEHESRRLTVLTSPVAGIVAAVEAHPGNSIAPRQLLMTVLPGDMDLAAEIYVPSRAAGFIRPGQTVQISYDAFPQQKFGTFRGRIERVSNFVVLPGEVPQPFPISEATYKVRVEIHDVAVDTSIGSAALRPGMLLVAEIILEKRNLVDWLLEPLRLRRGTAG
jgi:membrane fusion protein